MESKKLEQNEILDKFDLDVFKSIVEKVIVGRYNEGGNKTRLTKIEIVVKLSKR